MVGLKTLFTQTMAILLLAVLLLGAEHAQAAAAERNSYLKHTSEAKEDLGKQSAFGCVMRITMPASVPSKQSRPSATTK